MNGRRESNAPGTSRLLVVMVGGALLVGLAAGLLSYLGTSVVIAPTVRASSEELRERGATIYFESCAQFAEPRFWPECVGDADEKRARGARKLVEFCTDVDPYVRFFGPEDCLAADRPPVGLEGGPRAADLTAGSLAAAVAVVLFGALALVARRGRT